MGFPTHQKKPETHPFDWSVFFDKKKNLRQQTNRKYEQPTFSLKQKLGAEKINTASKIEVFSILKKQKKTGKNWGVDPGMMEKPKKTGWRSAARGC